MAEEEENNKKVSTLPAEGRINQDVTNNQEECDERQKNKGRSPGLFLVNKVNRKTTRGVALKSYMEIGCSLTRKPQNSTTKIFGRFLNLKDSKHSRFRKPQMLFSLPYLSIFKPTASTPGSFSCRIYCKSVIDLVACGKLNGSVS